jgi:hypothetical protein
MGDLAAALAFLDAQIAEIDDAERLNGSVPPAAADPDADPDGFARRRDEIARQAAALDRALRGPAATGAGDALDLEGLDLEWRFATPSTRR